MEPITQYLHDVPPALIWLGAGAVLSVGLFSGWRIMRRTDINARNHSNAAGRDVRINDK